METGYIKVAVDKNKFKAGLKLAKELGGKFDGDTKMWALPLPLKTSMATYAPDDLPRWGLIPEVAAVTVEDAPAFEVAEVFLPTEIAEYVATSEAAYAAISSDGNSGAVTDRGIEILREIAAAVRAEIAAGKPSPKLYAFCERFGMAISAEFTPDELEAENRRFLAARLNVTFAQ